ncbi:hypothetical protein AGR7B_pAt0147 [Agrobacterium deltaense RV3]|nr:hypothetical protein AGR7B_pAt0147 [Agrobacterium deltaense RV3]
MRDTIRDIIEYVPAIVEARQSKLTADAIDALVSVYMRPSPNADVERLLYDSNAKARACFLGSGQALPARIWRKWPDMVPRTRA